MRLPFLDRDDEATRLRRLCGRTDGALGVIYGRRRLGKSRLLREVLPRGRSVSYVADDRDSSLQRAALAGEIARVLPGFDRVDYPQWAALLDRFWQEAPTGAVLALDEFPALVAAATEVPSLLQKLLDRHERRGVRLLLTGSSQRMMQGLLLDRRAPLFGRAAELLKLSPLPVGWIGRALRVRGPAAIEAYAVWGGVPRYWELAADHEGLAAALRSLVLSPLGVLRDEPDALLLDDLRDTTQAASILSVIGQGCHRLSEIAGRLGKPVTSLSRPLQRLVELDLVRREVPFDVPSRDAKRSLYRIADPFLRFWFRFVEPNRSRLEAGRLDAVMPEVTRALPTHVASVWEDLARASVPALRCGDRAWKPAARWWGPGLDRRPMEIDVVAWSEDGRALLVGEARWSRRLDLGRVAAELRRKADNLPFRAGRPVVLGLWAPGRGTGRGEIARHSPEHVLRALR